MPLDALLAHRLSPARSKRSLGRFVAAWYAAQDSDPNVPRVTRVSTGGRPGYRVDEDSLRAWLFGQGM